MLFQLRSEKIQTTYKDRKQKTPDLNGFKTVVSPSARTWQGPFSRFFIRQGYFKMIVNLPWKSPIIEEHPGPPFSLQWCESDPYHASNEAYIPKSEGCIVRVVPCLEEPEPLIARYDKRKRYPQGSIKPRYSIPSTCLFRYLYIQTSDLRRVSSHKLRSPARIVIVYRRDSGTGKHCMRLASPYYRQARL